MLRRKYFLPVLFFFSLAGCAPLGFFAVGTAAGIGGYTWYQGTLDVIFKAPYIKTWDAALKVLEEMELTIESKKHDPTTGKIVAKRADEQLVTISFKYRSSEETDVSIRVGLFGDENASMVVKDKIRNKLFK